MHIHIIYIEGDILLKGYNYFTNNLFIPKLQQMTKWVKQDDCKNDYILHTNYVYHLHWSIILERWQLIQAYIYIHMYTIRYVLYGTVDCDVI